MPCTINIYIHTHTSGGPSALAASMLGVIADTHKPNATPVSASSIVINKKNMNLSLSKPTIKYIIHENSRGGRTFSGISVMNFDRK